MNHFSAKRLGRSISCLTLIGFVSSLFWLGTKPEWFGRFPVDPPKDKVVHLLVFGFIAALVRFSVSNPKPLVIFMITAMVAGVIECSQYYIPGRTASFA